MATSKSSSGGIGFTGLLTIAFIVLKLCHIIEWSWWWVLSPVLITTIIVLLILAVAILFGWVTRPKTPAEKAAVACRNIAAALRDRR